MASAIPLDRGAPARKTTARIWAEPRGLSALRKFGRRAARICFPECAYWPNTVTRDTSISARFSPFRQETSL
jgi:hypothetical protein